MQTEVLKVSGMTCGGCAANVTQSLQSLAGVENVSVSLAAGEARVQYDEQRASPEQLKSAVRKAGYDVDSQEKPKSGGCCCG